MVKRQKRRPGGQPANQNARTHGFYSRFLDPVDRQNIVKAAKLDGFDEEIALIRHKIKSLLATEPDNHVVIITAVTALSSLIRSKRALEKGNSRKLARAMEYILRDAAEVAGLLPAAVSSSEPSSPVSAESGSLSTNESSVR